MPYPYQGDNCYGRGDYYLGDYYRGDPGLFDVLKKGIKFIGKTAAGFVTGGPMGAARAALPAGVGLAVRKPSPFPPMIQEMAKGPAEAFGPPVIQQPVGTMLSSGFIPGCQLKGTRPNKSGYYKQVVKGNPAQVVYIPKGSVCVKSRRLNVANPRALRRSIRRAQGFAKLARRVLTFVSAKAPGRAKFKKR